MTSCRRYGRLALSQKNYLLRGSTSAEPSPVGSGRWRWLDGKWQRFPTAANADYSPAVGREGPNFDPNRYRPVSPATGTKTEASDEIRAEKSQREGQKTWWWLTGNTYPHKDMLKRWGCRWSKGRRAWYFIGENLPDAVQKIVTVWGDAEVPSEESTQDENVPCSDEAAEAILGVKLVPSVTEQDPVEHLFVIGQTVYYSGTKPLITEKGSSVTFGFAGTVLELHNSEIPSAILVHECLVQPNYKGKSQTAIFRTSEEQAVAKLLYHVRQLVNIPVFDVWAIYLYHAGQSAGLIRIPRSAGDIDLLLLDLDAEAWTRLITGGLANAVIALRQNTLQ